MKYKKKIILLLVIMICIILLWIFDAFSYLNLDRINDIKIWINKFGVLAPIIFIFIYIVATIFFLPGLPLTIAAGIIFGPIYGSIWVSIASTVGATLAFLVGRYIGRDFIAEKFSGSDIFKKIDRGIKKEGWKMLAITRLIPLFPFNAQNYIYGLTNISLITYIFVSWLCMLPATIAYVFLAGAIVAGEGDASKTVTYIGIGIGILIGLSLINKRINKRINKEEA